MVDVCSSCGTRVVPTRDGRCPACRSSFRSASGNEPVAPRHAHAVRSAPLTASVVSMVLTSLTVLSAIGLAAVGLGRYGFGEGFETRIEPIPVLVLVSLVLDGFAVARAIASERGPGDAALISIAGALAMPVTGILASFAVGSFVGGGDGPAVAPWFAVLALAASALALVLLDPRRSFGFPLWLSGAVTIVAPAWAATISAATDWSDRTVRSSTLVVIGLVVVATSIAGRTHTARRRRISRG